MAVQNTKEEKFSTEEKIKQAAKKVFLKKGYAGTRTRDIAEEAGMNLALLNYYFRSKEKLFEEIMNEKLVTFFGNIIPHLYDASTSLSQKLDKIVNGYLDMLLENPDLPLFVLGEIRSHPEKFINKIPNPDFLRNSVLAKQLAERNNSTNIAHFFVNMLGFCAFPFIMKPALTKITKTSNKQFEKLMNERRELIPAWMELIIDHKIPEK